MTPESIRIRTIRSLEELKAIRTKWLELQNHPNNDYEHYQIICRMREDFVSPYVVTVERDGILSSILVARLERTWLAPSIGYFKPIRIPTIALMILYRGTLGNIDEESAGVLVQHLWSFLESGKADTFVFNQLPENSPLLKAIEAICPRRYREKTTKATAHWGMTLPEQPGVLLNNMRSKHRSWINSRKKKLDSAFPGKIAWQWISRFDDISDINARLEVLAVRTYQRGLGAGFINDEEHRQRYLLFANRGQLRIQLLEIEGEVKAFWIGIVYQGVFHSEATGYDPDLKIYELGTLIFFAMVDELVRERVSKIDFGFGDASYKERFGDKSWMETRVRLFAPNLKGLLLCSIQGCFNNLDKALRGLLQKAGALDRVKAGLRRLARPKIVN